MRAGIGICRVTRQNQIFHKACWQKVPFYPLYLQSTGEGKKR